MSSVRWLTLPPHTFSPQLPADQVFRLSGTFRFSSALAALADKILCMKGERCPLRGARGVHTTIVTGDAPTPGLGFPTTVICRTNVSWLELAAKMGELAAQPGGAGGEAAAGKKLYIYTPEDAARWCDDAIDLTYLALGRRNMMQGRFRFKKSYREVVDEAKAEGDVAVSSLAALINRQGAGAMLGFIVRIQQSLVGAEEEAEVLSGTTHRLKGREYDATLVHSDLLQGIEWDAFDEESGLMAEGGHESLNLLYVAMTRGRKHVTLPASLLSILETYGRWEQVAPAAAPQCCRSCGVVLPMGALALCMPRMPRGGPVEAHLPACGPSFARVCAGCVTGGHGPQTGHGSHLVGLLARLSLPPLEAA